MTQAATYGGIKPGSEICKRQTKLSGQHSILNCPCKLLKSTIKCNLE